MSKIIGTFASDANPRRWLSPFGTRTVAHMIFMGLFYHAIGLALMNITHRIVQHVIPDYTFPETAISVVTTLAAGPIEESIFFGLPYLIFSNPYMLFAVGFLWSFLHLFNSQTLDWTALSYGGFFFTIPHIFFSIRTWMSGKGWLAIAFHSVWNVTIFVSVCAAGLAACHVLNPGEDAVKDVLLLAISVSISILMYMAYKTKQNVMYPKKYYLAVLASLVLAAIPLAIMNMDLIRG